MLLTVFSLFCAVFRPRWQKKTYLKRRPLFRSQILLRHPRLAFDWLFVSFFDYWPIRMSDLLLSLHWINPSSALNYLKTALILTNQNWVIFSCILLYILTIRFLYDILFCKVSRKWVWDSTSLTTSVSRNRCGWSCFITLEKKYNIAEIGQDSQNQKNNRNSQHPNNC